MHFIPMIIIPVIIAIFVAVGVYNFLKMFFNGKREEYRIISIAASFLIAIFAGFGVIPFLN